MEKLKKEYKKITKKDWKNIDKEGIEYVPLWIYISKCNRYRKNIIKLEKKIEELNGDLSSYKLIHKIQCESLQKKVKQIKELK